MNNYTQPSNFHKIEVGNFTVTALSDGIIFLSPENFHGIDHTLMAELLSDGQSVELPDIIPFDINTYLLDNGKDIVIVDVGSGFGSGEYMGKNLESLKAAGYKREDVTGILITHMHSDHVFGLLDEHGGAAFPNATLHISQGECDYWLRYRVIQQLIYPYLQRDSFSIFTKETEIYPEITAVPSNGHTPGHTIYLVTSNDEKMMIWGDSVHSKEMQLPYPQVTMDFDMDTNKAITTRRNILTSAAKEDILIAGGHMPFPGFGKIIAKNGGFRWIPVSKR